MLVNCLEFILFTVVFFTHKNYFFFVKPILNALSFTYFCFYFSKQILKTYAWFLLHIMFHQP